MCAKIMSCYFSPTDSTRKITQVLGKGINAKSGLELCEHDLTLPAGRVAWQDADKQLATDDLLVVGFPVYAGRVPQVFAAQLENLKGNNTAAVIVASYGNRACDDALLEASDILSARGFYTAIVVTFPCQHSWTANVGSGKPNNEDLKTAAMFGVQIADKLAAGTKAIEVAGNKPYAPHPPLDFRPVADADLCSACLACIAACPVEAIDESDPCQTDTVCIGCGACIKACANGAKGFNMEIIGPIIGMLEANCADEKRPYYQD